jgi:hypothetical protein
MILIRTQSLTVTGMTAYAGGWSYMSQNTAQSYQPLSGATAATMNANAVCSVTHWQSGVALDTTNSYCNPQGSQLDTLYLSNGNLFRALDEIANPNVISGTIAQGAPYTRQF